MSRVESDSKPTSAKPSVDTREIGLPAFDTYHRSPTDMNETMFSTRTSQLVMVA